MKTRKSALNVVLSVLLFQVMFLGSSCAQERSHGEEGEESGKRYSQTEKCTEVRKEVKLILSYDKASESFKGTIKNNSEKVAERARVEVHLSNGVELGPTEPVNLKPGKQIEVSLSAKGQKFEWWSTHAEVGSNEHGHGEGGEKGHGEEGEHGHGEESEHGDGEEGEHEHEKEGENGDKEEKHN